METDKTMICILKYIVPHQIYANHNRVARADRFERGLNFRADMQIRPYRYHKFNGASGYVWTMTILFQQPQIYASTQL